MKRLFIIFLGLLPSIALGVPEASVYPNSGTTDARRDENTEISPATAPPKESPVPQKEEEVVEKKDDFIKGPYDKDGNYRYIPEVRE